MGSGAELTGAPSVFLKCWTPGPVDAIARRSYAREMLRRLAIVGPAALLIGSLLPLSAAIAADAPRDTVYRESGDVIIDLPIDRAGDLRVRRNAADLITVVERNGKI